MAKAKQKPSRRAMTRRRNVAKRRETAEGRLNEDGASSSRHISRRLLWLAIEWHLEAPPKVGRSMSEALSDFCQDNRISFDWMLSGCLKGLKQMMDERRGRETMATQAANIAARYAQLSPAQQAIVSTEICRILAERDE
ncbi:hypothetical protein [Bradyrhizobium sp. McL0616]|uniref:hypothetical protein n=1 Tax=Bradyrhizobium sp. McL0616 TaxID=3415674 RepID=UPI003CECA3E7